MRLDAHDKRRQSAGLLLQEIPALSWNVEAADRYGEIAAHLQKAGQSLGEMDAVIAAHALVSNLSAVTHNVRRFSRIAGLKVEDWTV